MTPGAMAMVKLTLPIASSPPPTLARQAERRKTKKKVKPGFLVNSGFTFWDRHRGLSLRVMDGTDR